MKIPTHFVKLAERWHDGQSSMFYAIASSGRLARGSVRPFGEDRPMTNHEWMHSLLEKLSREINTCLEYTSDDPKQAWDHALFLRFGNACNHAMEKLEKKIELS